MLQRDLLKAEIERLAQVLARILQLRTDGMTLEAQKLFQESIEKFFLLQPSFLYEEKINSFEKWLEQHNLEAEKLESLSDFIYHQIKEGNPDNRQLTQRLNLIYTVLNKKYKILNFQHLSRQAKTKHYL